MDLSPDKSVRCSAADLENECDPSVEAHVGDDDFAERARDAQVTADPVDGDVSARVVMVVRRFTVDIHVDARPFRVHIAAAERKTVLRRARRSTTTHTCSERLNCPNFSNVMESFQIK